MSGETSAAPGATGWPIEVELVRRYRVQAAWSHLLAAPVGAVVVGWLMASVVDTTRALAWVGVVVLALCEHAVALAYHDRRHRAGRPTGWSLWSGIDIALQGFAWGSLALIAFPSAERPEAQVLVLVFICAATAGGTVSCAPLRAAYYPYMAAMWTPVVFAFATDGSSLNRRLALASLVYVGIMAVYFTSANRNVVDMVTLRHEVGALADRVASSQERTLAANAELRKAQHELERLAHADDLTGIANRRHLLARLETELAAGTAGVGLALVDVDRFKDVNDAHGHFVGDVVLRRVAERCAAAALPDGAAARFGGDEFAVLRTGIDVDALAAVADDLRLALAQTSVDEPGAAGVTVSIGVAVARPGEDVGALVARADAALYAAKRGGRDRVARADT